MTRHIPLVLASLAALFLVAPMAIIVPMSFSSAISFEFPPPGYWIGYYVQYFSNASWLEGCVALDAKGFVRTGLDLGAGDLTAAGWTLPRAPYLLETTKPGVFAAGDVRAGSVKRVASAVGEGSSCVQFVHRVLAS